jgi:hypothetical protein
VDYQKARELLLHHLRYSGGVDLAKAHQAHHDDAVMEFPQSGERFVGKPTSSAGASSTQHKSPTSRASSGEAGTSGSWRAGARASMASSTASRALSTVQDA